MISGAAHGLMIEHGSTFNRVVGDFLAHAERAYQQRTAADPAPIVSATA